MDYREREKGTSNLEYSQTYHLILCNEKWSQNYKCSNGNPTMLILHRQVLQRFLVESGENENEDGYSIALQGLALAGSWSDVVSK